MASSGGDGSGGGRRWFNDRRFTLTSPAARIRDNVAQLLSDVQQVARQNPELLGVIHQQLSLVSQVSRATDALGATQPQPTPAPPTIARQASQGTQRAVPGALARQSSEPGPSSEAAAVLHSPAASAAAPGSLGPQSPQSPEAETGGASTAFSSPADSVGIDFDDDSDEEDPTDAEAQEAEAGPDAGTGRAGGGGDDWARLVELLRSEDMARFLAHFLRAAPYIGLLLLHLLDVVTSSAVSLGLLWAGAVWGNAASTRLCQSPRRRLGTAAKGLIGVGLCVGLFWWGWGEETDVLGVASLAEMDLETSPVLGLGRLLWTLLAADGGVVCALLIAKLLVGVALSGGAIPDGAWGAGRSRGRAVQCLEYSAQLWRHWLPLRPWVVYFLHNERYLGWLVVTGYFVLKVVEVRWKLRRWWASLTSLAAGGDLGHLPSSDAVRSAGHCSICFADFAKPRQLPCSHIFCTGCLGEWLEREASCPMCRAKVAHDSDWRNGATNLLPHLI